MEVGIQQRDPVADVDFTDHMQALVEGKGSEVVAGVRFVVFLQLDLVDHLDLGACGHVLGDDTGGADKHVVADQHIPEHPGARADFHVVAQARVALAVRVVGDAPGAQGHATQDVAVIADLAGLADHRAKAMIQHKTPANAGGRVDFGAGQELALVAQSQRNGAELAVGRVGKVPDTMRQPVIQHGLERGVGLQDQFTPAAGRRIAPGVGDQVLGHFLRRWLDQLRQVWLQLCHLRWRQGGDEVGQQLIVQLLHVDKASHGRHPRRRCRTPWSGRRCRWAVPGRAWRWPPYWRLTTVPG